MKPADAVYLVVFACVCVCLDKAGLVAAAGAKTTNVHALLVHWRVRWLALALVILIAAVLGCGSQLHHAQPVAHFRGVEVVPATPHAAAHMQHVGETPRRACRYAWNTHA